MALEKLQLEYTPPNQDIYVAFFRHVSAESTQYLQKELLARNPAFEYALIDATSIISRAHLLSAIFNAVNATTTESLNTPNIHSEIVLSLSPNNNISDAYRRWGFQAGKTTNLIVVKVVSRDTTTTDDPSTQIWTHLTQHLTGASPVPLTDDELGKTTDWSKIRKYYKLNGVPGLEAIKDETVKKKEMQQLAIMAMALRGL